MKKKEKLRELFVEINKKPEGLDAKIMQDVYKQAKTNTSVVESKSKPWIWTYILLGGLILFGVFYTISVINFEQNALAWLIGLSVLIPLVIEKMVLSKSRTKTSYFH